MLKSTAFSADCLAKLEDCWPWPWASSFSAVPEAATKGRQSVPLRRLARGRNPRTECARWRGERTGSWEVESPKYYQLILIIIKKEMLGFLVRATTKVISRSRFRGYTWRNGDTNLGPPGCRPHALPLRYKPVRLILRGQYNNKSVHLFFNLSKIHFSTESLDIWVLCA